MIADTQPVRRLGVCIFREDKDISPYVMTGEILHFQPVMNACRRSRGRANHPRIKRDPVGEDHHAGQGHDGVCIGMYVVTI
ncbi:hypothetical protein [Komagataeibacter europaeus]|uniref:hypothetical protein n=1 Tax=Komagataeibacter europaeus TaxID=33995 RepID=UPI000A9D885A|nr:hypothetical protein [Komagataeibacter europaeus]